MLTLKGLPVAELLCAGEAPGDAGQIPRCPSPWAGWLVSSCTMHGNTLGKQQMEYPPLGNSQSNPHC